jgi:plasmid stabilization system protein ParE
MFWSWTHHEHNAEHFGNALLDHIRILASFPFLGARLLRRPAVRKLLHSPIRVYYRVDEKRKAVEILRFSHVAQREPDF